MPFDIDPQYVPSVAEPDVFSLDGLIAWLERQPAETEYEWRNCRGGCLVGLYGIANGLRLNCLEEGDAPTWNELHEFFYEAGWLGVVACRPPYTFGAALLRAKALRAQQEG